MFYGRKEELEILEKEYSKDNSFYFNLWFKKNWENIFNK